VRLGGLASAGFTAGLDADLAQQQQQQQQHSVPAGSSSSSEGGAVVGASWQAGLDSLRSSDDTDVLLARLAGGGGSGFGVDVRVSMADSSASSSAAGSSKAALSAPAAAQEDPSSVQQDTLPGHLQLHFQQPAIPMQPQGCSDQGSSGAAPAGAGSRLFSPEESLGSLSLASSGASSGHGAAGDDGCSSYRPLGREGSAAAAAAPGAGVAAVGSGDGQQVSRSGPLMQPPLPAPAGSLSALLAEILAEDLEG
jgi:hypothetical protein